MFRLFEIYGKQWGFLRFNGAEKRSVAIFLFYFILLYFCGFTWDDPVNEEIPNST